MAERLPNWTWDETLLAWDLYLREYAEPMRYADASHPSVRTLSEELRGLPIHPKAVRERPDFRNPAGVARKVQNLMWFATGQRYGSPNGSAIDRQIVAALGGASAATERATALRDVAPSMFEQEVPGEEEFAAEEGALLPRFHLVRERNARVVERKKREALASGGPLRCEVCRIAVAARYGVPEGAVIECHHRSPLAEGIRKTKPSDLALVCPTCHRALHRIRPWVSVEELAARVNRVESP